MITDDDFLPVGPRPGSDTRPVVQGVLLASDADGRRVQVSVANGDGAWMGYLTETDWSLYIGASVWVARDTITGQAVLCLGLAQTVELPEEAPDDVTLPTTGTVTNEMPLTVTAGGQTFTPNVVYSYAPHNGDTVLLLWPTPSDPWVLGSTGTPAGSVPPAVPGGFTASRVNSDVVASWSRPAGATAVTLRYSTDGGGSWSTRRGLTGSSARVAIRQGQTMRLQVQAVGPGGVSDWSSTETVAWSKPAPPPPKVITKTVTITPTWSGSYRHRYSRWDDWNQYNYGGRSTLWQGSKYGSGDMTGLATYGSRVTALRADEITKIEVTLRGVGLNSDHPSIVLQGSPHASKPGGAPSSSGATASGQTGTSSTAKVLLPAALREAFRTGDVRALATVGSGYGAVRGTSAADGMALKITYKTTI